jgi:hypothetical protein
MSRVLVYFGRFALIFIAYVCASLAASAFIHLVSLRALGFEVYDTPATLTGALAFSIPFVALFVSYFAFLPALPTILAAETFGWRGWLFYAMAGGAIALVIVAFAIQASEPGDNPFSDTRLSAAVVGGGIVGGLVYWLMAGRLAGNWRAKARPGVGGKTESA